MPGSALPAASRTAPNALYSGIRLSITLNTASLQRDVDHLALAAVHLAVVERGEDADRAVQRGQRVADRDAAAHRHAARLAGEVAQAAHRLADRAEARQVAVRPGLPVARDAQHHEAGVQLRQGLVAHAPAFERAGAEVLDQHVGLLDQLACDVLALGAAQVERDRALVARLHLPPDGGAVLDQAPVAQRVAGAGRLDLDDVGAEFAERLAGERAGDQLAHLDHAQALQRAWSGDAHAGASGFADQMTPVGSAAG